MTALDAADQPHVLSGTSFAAPLVAAAAGLTLSFDPTLTTPQLRDVMVNGAAVDGRVAGGVPLLNAYEILKLAARKPGTPLCGNRIWIQRDSILVERDGVDEVIAQGLTIGSFGLQTFHGGRRVDYHTTASGSRRTLTWSPTGWLDQPPAPGSTTGRTGASFSAGDRNPASPGRSHGGDMAVWLQQVDYNPPPTKATLYTQSVDPLLGSPTGPSVAIADFSGFIPNRFNGPKNQAAFSPLYGKAYVATRSTHIAPAASVYEVDLSTGQKTLLFTLPVAYPLVNLAISEDESELAIHYRTNFEAECKLEYRPLGPTGRAQRTIDLNAVGGYTVCNVLPGSFGS